MDIKAKLRSRIDSARTFIQLHFKLLLVLSIIALLLPFWIYTLFSLSPLSIFMFFLLLFLSYHLIYYILYHPKFKHYKKLLAFLVALFMAFFIVLTPICTDIVSNGSAFYSTFPVHVHVWVEEPLSADSARILTVMALESINQTFGYRMILKSVNTFQNDSIESYERGNRPRICELAHLRTKAFADGHITVNITYLKGVGPEADIAGGTGHAAGRSDWADDINLYFNNSEDIFSTSTIDKTLNNTRVILHEFGHSFGLKHDIRSIMWTAEEEDNPSGAPNPLNIAHLTDSLSMPNTVEHNTTIQDCYEQYIYPNLKMQIWHNFSKIRVNLTNTDVFGYSQSHTYILHDSQYHNITLVDVNEMWWDNGDLINRKYSVNYLTFNLYDFSHYWLPEELARC